MYLLLLVLSLFITSSVFADETIFGYIQFRPTNKVGLWYIDNHAYWGTRKTRLKPRSKLIKKDSCVRVEVNSEQKINKILLLTPRQCQRRLPKPYQFKPYKFK